MIIDCHCHAGHGDGLTGPWDTAAPLDAYLRRAARAGINRTVLLAAFHSDYGVANREVARIVASRPDRFCGFAFVHPDRDRGRVGEMVRVAVERYGFVGIKVHRHDGRISREVCEVARAFHLPVLYDVAGEISVVELLAEEYSDVASAIPMSMPIPRACVASTSSSKRFVVPARERSFSARTDPGFTRLSSSLRSARWRWPRPSRPWCSAETSFASSPRCGFSRCRHRLRGREGSPKTAPIATRG